MSFDAYKVMSVIRVVWQWWIGELQGFIPAFWKGGRLQDKPSVRLFIDETSVFLEDVQGIRTPIAQIVHSAERIAVTALTGSEDITALHRGQAAVIEFTTHYCLSHSFSVPLLAEDEVKSVVELGLSRNFPLSSDRLFFAFHFTNDKDSEKTKIVTAVIRRNIVEDILSFVRSAGLRPASVISCEKADVSLEFRRDLAKSLRGKMRRFYTALAVFPFVIFALSASVLMFRMEISLSRVEGELQSARDEAAIFSAKRDRLRNIVTRAEFLESVFLVPDLPEILDELSRLIPDGTWVRELRMRNNHVVLAGETPDLAPVIPALESSHLFQSVELVSLNQSTTGGLNGFELELTLKAKESSL